MCCWWNWIHFFLPWHDFFSVHIELTSAYHPNTTESYRSTSLNSPEPSKTVTLISPSSVGNLNSQVSPSRHQLRNEVSKDTLQNNDQLRKQNQFKSRSLHYSSYYKIETTPLQRTHTKPDYNQYYTYSPKSERTIQYLSDSSESVELNRAGYIFISDTSSDDYVNHEVKSDSDGDFYMNRVGRLLTVRWQWFKEPQSHYLCMN